VKPEITLGYWKRRDGQKTRVLCTDAVGDRPVICAHAYADATRVHFNYATGRHHLEKYPDSDFDLIEPWTEPKKTRVVRYAPAAFRGANGRPRSTMEAFISEEQAKEVCKEIFIKWPYNESSWIEIEEDVADE
jgi:hypothetical protein